MSKIKILSIDSSMSNTGVAWGEFNGTLAIRGIKLLETEKSKVKQVRASSDTITRGRSTYQFINEMIETFQPNVIFVETPSGSQSASGMKSYGMTCQLIATLSPEPIEITPIEVKKLTVGSKTATKEEMILWAHAKHPDLNWIKGNAIKGTLANKNEHLADAIAIAHAGICLPDFKRLVSVLSAKN